MNRSSSRHMPAQGEVDHFLHRLIHVTMLSGLILSVGAMAVGLLLKLTGGPDMAATAEWLMQAGLVALLATPVLRVGVAIVGYVMERDRLFTIISTVVLLMLFVSFFVGRV